MSVQIQPAVIVEATTQMPKAIIPAEINRESAVSMVSPLSSERKPLPRMDRPHQGHEPTANQEGKEGSKSQRYPAVFAHLNVASRIPSCHCPNPCKDEQKN
jgi:hypothetical protein